MFAVVVSIAVCCLCLHLWSRRNVYRLAWALDGPMAWPLFGNVLSLSDDNVYPHLLRFGEKFTRLYRFWLGPYLVVILTAPDLIETVLNSPHCLDKGAVYWVFKYILGVDGLVTSQSDVWKIHRKLMNPTLQHYSLIRTFFPTFNKYMKILTMKMETISDDEEINIGPLIECCSLDMILKTTFGTTPDATEKRNSSVFDAFHYMIFFIGFLVKRPWLCYIFNMTKHKKLVDESRATATDFVQQVVDRKIQEFLDKSSQHSAVSNPNPNEDENSQKVFHNFIDESRRLTMETNVFSDEALIAESLTILLAGYETTGLTVSYVVLMLAMHPEHQEKVFQEISSVLPDQDSDVQHSDLAYLEYTSRFIKESLRLNPTVPIISRTTEQDIQLGDVFIPAGTQLAIPIFQIHRSTAIWGPTASEFDPDRFLPENQNDRHAYAFLPFSAGPRNCIGIKYAQTVVRMFVCWLVRNYRFSTSMRPEDMQHRISVTMSLDNGYMVKLHRREKYNTN